MRVEIGKYKVSYADAQRLMDIAKKIDENKKELSQNEELVIEKTLEGCKGNISSAERCLQEIVLHAKFIPEVVYISAGTFVMGSTEGEENEWPPRKVRISAFKMGKYEVANEEFREYLKAVGQLEKYPTSDMWTLDECLVNEKFSRYPVSNVNWYEAVNYCAWLSQITGRKFRLPTEAEWEYAARGTDGRKYPWGNEWDSSKVLGFGKVGAHPKGASPFGVMDMAGNVWEWTMDRYTDKYNPKDLVNPKGPKTGNEKVIRGGSYRCTDNSFDLRTALRNHNFPENRNFAFGFRVAEDISTNK